MSCPRVKPFMQWPLIYFGIKRSVQFTVRSLSTSNILLCYSPQLFWCPSQSPT